MPVNTSKWTLFAFAWFALAFCVQATAVENFRQVRTSVAAPTAPQEVRIKSYREWKSEKVQEALTRVISTKTQLQIAKNKDPNLAHRKGTEAVSGTALEKLEEQLADEQNSLEIARDLSVSDYFAGYLNRVPNKKAAFTEVALKLTPEEVAELMAAYANSVFGARTSELPPSASAHSLNTLNH